MTQEARAPNRADLTVFLAVAFGGSWGLAAAFYLAGVRLTSLWAVVIGVPYMFFPALGAWVAERRRGARVVQSLELRFKPNWWWLAGWLAPLALAFIAFGFGLLIPGVSLVHGVDGLLDKVAAQLPPEKLAEAKAKLQSIPLVVLMAGSALQALVAGPTLNALAAFGEELGWRGYLQRAVAPLGFWKGSAVVGLLWGPWHAALIVQGYNYPQHPFIGAVMMSGLTVGLSPFLAAVRLHGKSVIASSVAHGSVNACAGFAVLLLKGGDDLTVGLTGAAGFAALALGNAVLWVVLRRFPVPAQAG